MARCARSLLQTFDANVWVASLPALDDTTRAVLTACTDAIPSALLMQEVADLFALDAAQAAALKRWAVLVASGAGSAANNAVDHLLDFNAKTHYNPSGGRKPKTTDAFKFWGRQCAPSVKIFAATLERVDGVYCGFEQLLYTQALSLVPTSGCPFASIVMVGDPSQLSPRCKSKDAEARGFKISLVAKFMHCHQCSEEVVAVLCENRRSLSDLVVWLTYCGGQLWPHLTIDDRPIPDDIP
ncbi:unnamed protein product [Prorocentrum cordatum]|uniref:DNA helicase n=1 Tax=Prorocentrum cordatum TaxID=2364126 RepID=A0ABN9UMI6_9DINO|nr:unnamed protein product [Polarella glacialis]